MHLAESGTSYRFLTYQKTNRFRNALLEEIKKDMENLQNEYRDLIKDIS